MSEREELGIILSGASTIEAKCQLLEGAERGLIKEGILVLIQSKDKKRNPILARIGQIIPHNAFYMEGDPWTEARRKGMSIPEGIARQYEICNLDLLIELPKGEIKYPPRPGDIIERIDPKIHEKDIYGVNQNTVGFSWYGTLTGYPNAPVPLDIEKIPMHMAVFGTTGSGKSFDTGALIEKFMKIKSTDIESVSFPMFIIDANGDYIDYAKCYKNNFDKFKEKFRPVGWVKRFVFPHVKRDNPKLFDEDSLAINLDVLSNHELAETIITYYKGTTEGAELQVSGLITLFEYINEERERESLHSYFEKEEDFKELLTILDKEIPQNKLHGGSKKAIERALEKFFEIEKKYFLFSEKKHSEITKTKFIDDITSVGGLAIIDFSEDGATGVDIQTKQLVMTYLASALFNKFTKYKINEKSRYLIFLIEEAQNFIPNPSYPIGSSLAKKKLSLIATQGRKFGLSLCLVTQRPSFMDKIVLSMCNTFFIHRISPEDVSYVKSVTGGLPSSVGNRLTRLNQGELILTGQMNRVPFPLLIRVSRNDRIPHTAGKTEVMKTLRKLKGGSL